MENNFWHADFDNNSNSCDIVYPQNFCLQKELHFFFVPV